MRKLMRAMGLIPDSDAPVAGTEPEAVTIKQWEDSAGAYLTELYDEKGRQIETWYALGKYGARWHAGCARRYGRKFLRDRARGADRAGGWELTGDYMCPKRREFKVTK